MTAYVAVTYEVRVHLGGDYLDVTDSLSQREREKAEAIALEELLKRLEK